MIRFGMCGCGGFVERAVLPMMVRTGNARPVAAFDVDADRVRTLCERFDIAHACGSFGELIARDDVDAVYVASPNALHKQQTIAAAHAGKHVFCQKPMAMNAGECRAMVDACHAAAVKLGIGFCYPFAGPQRKARELVRDGAIGDVSLVTMSFSLGGYNKETVGWRCDPKLSGGGPLMDVAPHLVNLACFLFDDRVRSVMAYVEPDLTDDAIELDATAMLEMAGGGRAFIDTSFVRGNPHRYTIIGRKGQIRAVGTMAWRVEGTLDLSAGGDTREVSFEPIEGIEHEIREFADAIERDADPPMPGESGLHVQAVIDAIYESGRSGRRLSVESDPHNR